MGGINPVHDSTGRGQQEAPHLGPSWTLPHKSPFADFNLYPFSVMNHNHEINSF